MKKGNGGLYTRMMAVLLSAALALGMVWNAAPMTALAQADTDVCEDTGSEPQGSVSGNEAAIAEERESENREESDSGTVSGNEAGTEFAAEPESTAEQQSVTMMAAPAAQAGNIASGEGWEIDADGKLTITTDAGMEDWSNNREGHRDEVTSLVVTSGVKDIPSSAFWECSLVEADIQEGVLSIGVSAFWNCIKLEQISLPDSLKTIGNGAFQGCKVLKSIHIPEGVGTIEQNVFTYCSALENVTLPKNLKTIDRMAFSYCTSLKTLQLPEGLKEIQEYALSDLGLTRITIPKTVEVIGTGASDNCLQLESITFLGDEPPELGTEVFGLPSRGSSYPATYCKFIKEGKKGIFVPDGRAETYKNAGTKGWGDWTEYIADGAEPHNHGGVDFTAWTRTDSLPEDAGNYYLAENVTLTEAWNVPSGTTTLCLNGMTLTQTTDNWTFSIGSGSTLKLYDCGDAGKIISEGHKNIFVDGGGTLYMYGGNISGYSGDYAAVYVYKGEFHMNGGKISGNENYSSDISDSSLGGGVNIRKGIFYMEDGEISDNVHKGEYGGGVILMTSTLYMSGGKISGNTTGIYTVGSEIYMSGGEITGNQSIFGGIVLSGSKMTAGGSVVITGNTDRDGKEKNLFFMADGPLNIDPDNPLSDFARIGVTTHPDSAPAEDAPFNITGENGEDYSRLFFSDSEDYKIVNGKNNVVQLAVKTAHTHDCGEWEYDSAQHWKTCRSCQEEIDRGNHNFGLWTTDVEATATQEGTRHRDCGTCQYREIGTVPATGTDPGAGDVTPEVRPGENAPATSISTPAAELEDMLLTDEEKQKVQNGANIRIILEVQNAEGTVSDSDKAGVEQALGSYSVGQYLGIDLYALTMEADGQNTRRDISETERKLRILITVPEGLRNTDSGKTRTFAVIRVHGGSAELLEDLDNAPETITIETDRFSTYAVVYQDKAEGDDGGDDGNNGSQGGDSSGGGGNADSGNEGSGNHGGSGSNEGSGNHGGSSGNEGSGNHGGSSGNEGSGSNNEGSGSNHSGGNGGGTSNKKDSEPKTGDTTHIELYATLAMIAGFAYVLLYFTERKRGMTEEVKKELVSRIAGWAKRGGRLRRCLALAAIFVLLVYYHCTRKFYRSIDREACAERKGNIV